MVSILKYLKSEGGYISAAMAIGSMIMNGVMGSQKNKKFAKLMHKTGEEKNLQTFADETIPGLKQPNIDIMNQGAGTMSDALGAARGGGLMDAIKEAFSQRPSTPELNAVAAQERQLKNQALATGARGGLLRQQMFEAGKNAAANKMNIMENARQNALQRAFQIFQPMAPTQGVDVARRQNLLGYDTLANADLQQLARQGVERNMAQAGVAAKDAQGSGSGLGSVLGGLFGGGDSGGGLGGLLGGLFGGGGGTSGGGSSPAFGLGTSIMGQGGWGGFGSNVTGAIY